MQQSNAGAPWGQDVHTSVRMEGVCPYCSGPYNQVVHGGRCPKIKAIEYHPNGAVKRVEFKDA